MTQEIKQVVFRTTEQKKYQLRVLAAQHNMSINEYLNWLIDRENSSIHTSYLSNTAELTQNAH